MKLARILLAVAVSAAGCTRGATIVTREPAPSSPADPASFHGLLDDAAARYTKLALSLGEHDAAYVDAYYGPRAWRDEAKSAKKTLEQIRADAAALARELTKISPAEDLTRLRHVYLSRQLSALSARAGMLSGTKLSFDVESKALYDAVAPRHDQAFFTRIVAELERELPAGLGTVADRFQAFRKQFIVPADKLDGVFKKAIEATRQRSLDHIELPPEESFTVEYVRDKPWGAYNWYQGGYRSVIQVNTDLPVYIDRALDLAGHEGYPGHHVYNVLLEKHLVKERGWVEFSVYPLFSPQSLIAEGSANYGVEVVFPPADRAAWEKVHLFPLAGLAVAEADRYYRVIALLEKLNYADNEAARRYLDGEMTSDAVASWLVQNALLTPDRAQQRLRFIKQYGSYVINYNLGKDLVREHVEASLGPARDTAERWRVFEDLLSSPRLPSELKRAK